MRLNCLMMWCVISEQHTLPAVCRNAVSQRHLALVAAPRFKCLIAKLGGMLLSSFILPS